MGAPDAKSESIPGRDRPILVIDGHPDPDPAHFDHALAEAYRDGALGAGRDCTVLRLADLDFPLLRRPDDWLHGAAPPGIAAAQALVHDAGHLVLVYPLWLGDVPALLKGFLEQLLRPGFAFTAPGEGPSRKLLGGRTARIVVTMGMPTALYRLWFRAHGLRSLERNVLGFVGIGPVARTIIGSVEGSPGARGRWLARMRKLGGMGL